MAEYSRPIVYSPDSKGALNAIEDLKYEMNNPYNDGFTGSIMKRRLVQINRAAKEALVGAPKFSNDEDILS
ncbi:MAG: hypothetical protein CL489_05985 [Acidobacteria bacterium]|jgi:hypothetical protein|nr:hypothetical protein [Acidobacteriota bacterium]